MPDLERCHICAAQMATTCRHDSAQHSEVLVAMQILRLNSRCLNLPVSSLAKPEEAISNNGMHSHFPRRAWTGLVGLPASALSHTSRQAMTAGTAAGCVCGQQHPLAHGDEDAR